MAGLPRSFLPLSFAVTSARMSVSYDPDIRTLGIRAAREGVYQAAARIVIRLQAPPDLLNPYYVSVMTPWWVCCVRMW